MGPGVPPDLAKTPWVQRYQLDALLNRAYPLGHAPPANEKKATIFILIPCPNC